MTLAPAPCTVAGNSCLEKRKAPTSRSFSLTSGGASRSRTGLNGFAGRCITALLSRHKRTAETVATSRMLNGFADLFDGRSAHQTKREALLPRMSGAGDEARTRDLNLGKVALYQLSYSRMLLPTTYCYYFTSHCQTTQNAASKIWSGRRGSNSRPQPWQGCALPTELLPRFAAYILLTAPRCSELRASEKRDYV
jgi:hypothetical protein